MPTELSVERVSDVNCPELAAFLRNHPSTLVYHSPPYLNLLADFLGAEARHLQLRDRQGQVCGFLPAFRRDGFLGPVLNALPFYGSQGTPLVADESWRPALLDAFRAEAAQVWSATMVGSPFDPGPEGGLGPLAQGWTWMDERVGQVTPLVDEQGAALSPEALLAAYDGSARRNVKKAAALGYLVARDEAALPWLVATHHQNMAAMGGLAKPAHFFEALARAFAWGESADLWVARLPNGELGAALLALVGPTVVEYFTPVVSEAHRSDQSLALLCHEAMCHYAAAGFLAWNWGGTWRSQEGVYRFKKKFGAEDRPYRYATRLAPEVDLRAITPAQLLEAYPYFYTCAFQRLGPLEGIA